MAGWEKRVLAATVEILDDRGKLIGSGVLIDETRVLTAAHVIRNKTCTLTTVSVRFTADKVCASIPLISDEADVAVLTLPDDLTFSLPDPVAIAALERTLPERGRVLGYPSADPTDKGVWRSFRVGGPVGAGGEYRQLDWEDSTGSFKGHSGGPVVDGSTGEILGILTEGSKPGAFDRFLVMWAISSLVAGLRPRWVFAGQEARAHVTRRAHGHLSSDARGGDFFTGREVALSKVRDWLDAGHQVGRPLVITGQPGAGKSAVLGRAALEQEALGLQAGLVFHARSATYAQFLSAAREVVDLDQDEDVLSALRLHVPTRGLAVMVDALDEAATRRDAEQIAGILAGMAGVPGVAVVVATRPGIADRAHARGTLLMSLNAPTPQAMSFVDLDSDPYFDPNALAEFAAALLCQDAADCPYPADGAWPCYRGDRQLTQRLATAIADRAGKNYLVAALTSVSLSENLPVVDPHDRGFDPKQLPTRIGEALEKVIDREPVPMARLTRGLLTALAYAEGSGIPDGLWLAFTNALHYEAGPASLRDLKASSVADFLLQMPTDDELRVTRLFHQGLTDELLGSVPDRSDAAAIYQTILDQVRKGGGWACASDYILANAPTHALKADRLAELLKDPDALAYCDPVLLTSAILEDQDARKSPIGRVFLRAAGHLSRVPPGRERIALLILTGAHLGFAPPLGTDASTGWALVWAHSLGQPHQQLTVHKQWGEQATVAVGRLGGRDVVVSGGADGTVRLWDQHGASAGNSMGGHPGGVWGITVGRLGGRDVVVSGGADGTVRLWDQHGAPIGNPLEGHQGAVAGVAVGRLGGREVVVSAGWDGTVRLWDENGAPIGNPLEGHQSGVLGVAVGCLGGRDVVISGGWDGTVRIWDEHGAPIGNPMSGNHSGVAAVAVGCLAGQDVVVSAGWDGTVRIWDEHGAPIGSPLEGHRGWVLAVAVGRLGDREVVVSAGADGTVRVWDEHDAAGGNPLAGHTGVVTAVASRRRGGRDVLVSAGADGTVRLWDENGAPIGDPLDTGQSAVRRLAVGRLGGLDVVVSAGTDGTVRLRDEHGAPIKNPLTEYEGWVTAVAVGPLGGRDVVVSAERDGTVRLWDADGAPIGSPMEDHISGVMAVAMGALGGRDVVISADSVGTMCIWDEHGALVGTPWKGHNGPVLAVVVGHLGGRDVVVSAGWDGIVCVWDEHGALVGTPWKGHNGPVLAVVVGHLGGRDVVVSAGDDGTVRVGDEHGAPVGNPVKMLTSVPALALANSVLTVATGRAIARFERI